MVTRLCAELRYAVRVLLRLLLKAARRCRRARPGAHIPARTRPLLSTLTLTFSVRVGTGLSRFGVRTRLLMDARQHSVC